MTKRAKRLSPVGGRARRRPRRLLLVVALVSVTTVTVAIFGAVWYRSMALEPPTIDFAGQDPALVAAVEKARLAVRQEPRSATSWGRLGMVFLAHDFPAEATTCLAQAESLDPREPRWPYYQGIALYQEEPDTAIPKLEHAVELFGEVPDAPRLLLAEVLYGQGRQGDAEEQFRRVLQHQPDNARAQLGLGRLAYRHGNLDECRARLSRSAADARTRKASAVLLAEVHQRIGNQTAANQALHQAATMPDDPAWPDPFVQECMRLQTGKKAYLDRANRMLDQGLVAEAIPLLQQAVRDYPDADWAWLLLGKAFLKRKDLVAAVQALQTAVRLEPNSVEAQFHLGIASFSQEDRRTAAACFRKVTELKPDAQAHYLLGRCLELEGDPASAIEAFRQALRYKPNYAEAHQHLGTLLAQRGQTAEALVHLRSAIELNPTNPTAKKLLVHVWKQTAIPLGP